jgi:thymidylate synthase
MNNLDKQYTDLLQDILDNGVTKQDRTGTGTLSVFGRQIRHKMSEGFPLLTTKKMPFKTITTELLWFLRGDTNIKYLVDNNCHIWDGDAYKNYEKITNDFQLENPIDDFIIKTLRGEMIKFETEDGDDYRTLTQEEFINKIKTDAEFAERWGDLGPVYGKQWREWKQFIPYNVTEENCQVAVKVTDQIANLINDLKTNPDSRRLMVNAWNVGELDSMVLPPCHYGFQVYTRELSYKERRKLFEEKTNRDSTYILSIRETLDKFQIPTRAISLMWDQRSVDTFLGLPFNIASYGLLLEIIAKEVNMVPDELIGNLGDTHLYLNHIDQAKEQIGKKYDHEERHEMLKVAMGPLKYQSAVDEQVPFGGGLSEYYDMYKIPYKTREPYPLPILDLHPGILDYDMEKYPIGLFEIKDYRFHSHIKAPLSN